MITKLIHTKTLDGIVSECVTDSGFGNKEEILEFLDDYSKRHLDLPNAGEWLAATPRQNGYPINELIAAGTIFSIYKKHMEEKQSPARVPMLDVGAGKLHQLYRSVTHMHNNSSASHGNIPGFREIERRVRQYLGIDGGGNPNKEATAGLSPVSTTQRWYGQLRYSRLPNYKGVEVYLDIGCSVGDVKKFKGIVQDQIKANPGIRAGIVNISMTHDDMVNRKIILGISTGNDELAEQTYKSLIGYLTKKGAVEKK